MERCERFEELLSQRLDQPLPTQEERELEDHLARCPRCGPWRRTWNSCAASSPVWRSCPPRRALPRG